MKKNLLIAAMGLLVLAGCSNNDEIDNLVANNENAITFDSYVGKVTKAPINQKFGVFAYEGTWNAATSKPNFMFNQEVEIDGTYAPIKYWPGTSVSFIAYAPFQASASGEALKGYTNAATGLPTMDFTLGAEADVDLLVSDLVSVLTGPVPLVLKHALSKVTFSAGATGDANTTINITKVELTGMSQTAVLSFKATARTWGEYSKTEIFSVTQGSSYLLIPQTLTGLKADITYTITTTDTALTGGEFTTAPKTAEIPLATTAVTEWETSKQYNYTIKPVLDKVVLEATEDEWITPTTPEIPE